MRFMGPVEGREGREVRKPREVSPFRRDVPVTVGDGSSTSGDAP